MFVRHGNQSGRARSPRRLRTPAAIALAAAVACAANGLPVTSSGDESVPRTDLAAFTGWYALAPDRPVLVTWAATGDLKMFAFGDAPMAASLEREEGSTFRWTAADGTSRVVRFGATGGRAPGFTWSDGDGESRFAPALAHDGYEARELAFTHDGVRLAGTLFSPRNAPAGAAAVLIHGSGTSDRDNYWYMSIVHALASRGIAVLLPDKRGSGRSGGDWRTASFDVLAGDAAAAVGAVRDAVGPADVSIGVIGLSQGGRVAPIVPAQSRHVSFVVNVSGAAVTPAEQLQHETRMTLRQSRWPGFLHGLVRPLAVRRARGRNSEWWALNGTADPIPAWRALQVPGLVVYGAEDEYDNVPVTRSVERLREADATGAPAGLTILVFERSGHALYAPGTTRVREDFLQQLADWIRARRDLPGTSRLTAALGAEPARRHANVRTERAAEVRVVGESARVRDLGDRHAPVGERRSREIDPERSDVLADGCSPMLAERAGEVHRVHAQVCRHRAEADRLPEAVVKELDGSTHPVRSLRVSAGRPCPAGFADQRKRESFEDER